MKILKHEFSDAIKIMNLGDTHRGDESCDVNALLSNINYIAENENVFWVSTGDMLNVATKASKSSTYKSLSPQKELDTFEKELAPIANKCLGFVSSNHHNRISNEVGLSLDKAIARNLNIPYLGDIGVLNIKVGASCYYIAMHHGVGGGKRRGNKTNNLEDLSLIIPGADVYMEGHSHSFDHFINETHYIDKKRNNLVSQKAYFVTTGHYVKWDGSYAQGYKLKPMPIGSSIITLQPGISGRDKKVEVDFM